MTGGMVTVTRTTTAAIIADIAETGITITAPGNTSEGSGRSGHERGGNMKGANGNAGRIGSIAITMLPFTLAVPITLDPIRLQKL